MDYSLSLFLSLFLSPPSFTPLYLPVPYHDLSGFLRLRPFWGAFLDRFSPRGGRPGPHEQARLAAEASHALPPLPDGSDAVVVGPRKSPLEREEAEALARAR